MEREYQVLYVKVGGRWQWQVESVDARREVMVISPKTFGTRKAAESGFERAYRAIRAAMYCERAADDLVSSVFAMADQVVRAPRIATDAVGAKGAKVTIARKV